MPFDPTTISDVRASVEGAELLLSWTSSAPAGSVTQIYENGTLAWVGTATSASLPYPSGLATIDVGSVGADEASTDFSDSLDPIADRAVLSWTGGNYLDPGGSIDHFAVRADAGDGWGSGGYSASGYGGPLDDASPATVAAYPAGIAQDGWNRGGYGSGGFGSTAGSYTWTSDALASGTYDFSVSAVDTAGNEGVRTVAVLAIAVPPRAPAADGNGRRLTYTYNPTTHVATLHWAASPDASSSTNYHVYSGSGVGGPVDYTTPIGTTAALSFAPSALAIPSDTTFAVRAFDLTSGLEEMNVDARVRILVSATGSDLSSLPAPPSSLSAQATAGGGAVVRWAWTPAGSGGPPTGFHVYATTPTVTYGSPSGTVPYVGGRVAFSASLSGLADGSVYQVAVRSYNASGEETNSVVVSVTGDSAPPDAVDDLTATATG